MHCNYVLFFISKQVDQEVTYQSNILMWDIQNVYNERHYHETSLKGKYGFPQLVKLMHGMLINGVIYIYTYVLCTLMIRN